MKKDIILKNLFRIISYIVFIIIIMIFFLVIFDGIKYFSLDFFTKFPMNGMTSGGIFPAILGSFLVLLVTLIFSIPIGVLTGVFMSEYGGNSFFGRLLDVSITSLSGVPSIVFGLFGLAVFSITFQFGTSLIAGSLTLAVMTLPVISSSVREALVAVPNTLRESAYALGAKKTEVIFKVLIPAAKSRILTAVLIGSGRILGETAPIILTGATFYLTRLPKGLKEPIMTLPSHIYFISMAYGNDAQWMAKATASFLMLFIIIIYIIVFNIRRKLNAK